MASTCRTRIQPVRTGMQLIHFRINYTTSAVFPADEAPTCKPSRPASMARQSAAFDSCAHRPVIDPETDAKSAILAPAIGTALYIYTRQRGRVDNALHCRLFGREGRVDARTASIVPKSPKQFLKSFSALLSLFVPLPLCTINVPSVIWLTLYKLFALLARLSVFQHIFNPPFRRGLGLNQAEWSRCVAKLHSLWRHHQTAAVEAPTGTGKGQVLLNLLHECHGGILALATTRTVQDGLPGTLTERNSLTGIMFYLRELIPKWP